MSQILPMQSLVGMVDNSGATAVCWDPLMGMYRATTGCPPGLFEQMSQSNGESAGM
jgi:hypothetical protein